MYEEAIKILTSKGNFHIDLGLDRISKVLNFFDNPQDKLKYIHGYRVGLYTSPHIWEYTERIKINGENIPKEEFSDLIFDVTNKAKNNNIHLTEFEILTVVMFLYFQKNNVDVVILETGLGGRLDATNVIKKNLCSIITQIDLDHTERLGNTKNEIAYEKAGIIKKECPVITSMGYEAIRDKADKENSMFILATPFVNPMFIEACSLKGMHQVENLALAINAIQYLFKDISDKTIIEGLKKVKNPCRFQYIPEKNLIIDASHNPNGIKALRENLDYYFPNEKRRFIFGCLRTKDYEKMMNILFKDDDEIFLNEFDYPNAATYNELKAKCPINSKKYNNILELDFNKLTIICGSFYMIGNMNELREFIN